MLSIRRVARSLLIPLALTAYGAIGIVFLSLLLGLLAVSIRDSGYIATLERLLVFTAAYAAWLYIWRALALYVRTRACERAG